MNNKVEPIDLARVNAGNKQDSFIIRDNIMTKYDVNNDGVFSGAEVKMILNDFAATVKLNNSLKRLIGVAIGLIVILSVSNLGTAFLAVNLSKEMHVSSDGTLVANDKEAAVLRTQSHSETFKVKGRLPDMEARRRGLRSLADDEENPGANIACLPAEMAEKIFELVSKGSTVAMAIQDVTGVSSSELTMQISGEAMYVASSDGELDSFIFPESGIEFKEIDISECVNAEEMEELQDHDHDKNIRGRQLRHLPYHFFGFNGCWGGKLNRYCLY